MNALVMDFALPWAIFVAIVQRPGALLLEHAYLIIVLAVSMLVIYGLQFFLEKSVFKIGTCEASVQSQTVGLPKASQQTAKDVAALLPLIARSMRRSLLKPIVLAPIAAVALSLFNAGLPQLLESSLNLIGICAAGVMLFVTGLILSSQPFSLNRNVVSATLLKNVAHPLLSVALVMVLAAPALIGREAIILCAVPAGFFGILFGLRYCAVSQDAGSTLIASSILSVITVPAAIVLTAGPQ